MAKKTPEEQEQSDSWGTPQWLYDELDKEFKFNVDAAANSTNSKCIYFVENTLEDKWKILHVCGEFTGIPVPDDVFYLNPPYSNPRPFIESAWEQSKLNVVVCLIKVDPSTATWRVFWDHEKHEPRLGCKIRYLPKRVNFVPPPGWKAKDGTTKANGPSFPVAVIVMDRRALST